MINKLQQLEFLVIRWAEEKGLLTNITPERIESQTDKVLEEIGETAGAFLKKNMAELKDGIGDIAVTVIILAKMRGWKLDYSIVPPMEIRRKLQIISHLVVSGHIAECAGFPGLDNDLSFAMVELEKFAHQNGFDLSDCLQTAYDVISKRKGSMVGDTFIKDDKIVALYTEEQLKQAQFAYYNEFDLHPEDFTETLNGDRKEDAESAIEKLLSFVQSN